jgi:large conductance mechanosensitive channel
VGGLPAELERLGKSTWDGGRVRSSEVITCSTYFTGGQQLLTEELKNMSNLISEFKNFINRGNLVDLAIAVVLATFFAPIITAIVDGVILNLVAAIFGQPNFDSIGIDVGESRLLIGSVINAIVMFLIVAFVCFLIVKQINKMKVEKEEVASGPSETDLLAEIRDAIKANND